MIIEGNIVQNYASRCRALPLIRKLVGAAVGLIFQERAANAEASAVRMMHENELKLASKGGVRWRVCRAIREARVSHVGKLGEELVDKLNTKWRLRLGVHADPLVDGRAATELKRFTITTRKRRRREPRQASGECQGGSLSQVQIESKLLRDAY